MTGSKRSSANRRHNYDEADKVRQGTAAGTDNYKNKCAHTTGIVST